MLEIETICSDEAEHRQRVAARASGVRGLASPGWTEVTKRDYRAWERDHLVIDTSARRIEFCVEQALAAMRGSTS